MLVIAGYGYVGKAVYEAFKDHITTEIVDPQHNTNKISDFKPTYLIVAVSTPQADSGECDMSNVFDVVSQTDTNCSILIKSTISLEGWQELKQQFPNHKITFSPEFLRAKTATEDFLNQDAVYFGGDEVDDWIDFFCLQFANVNYFRRTPEELILAKYFRNSFLATKVTFFNQVYDLCEQLGIDYANVKDCVTRDERIGTSHSEVTEERGYSGHCLPKDTQAIVKTAQQHDVDLSLINEAIKYNQKIKK